jgi:hypothetical protein
MRTMWLSCREVENLYITDEVLEALGFDNDSARQKLIEGGLTSPLVNDIFADKLGSAQVKVNINEISAILGHKLDRWQQRIGKTIGKAKPTGELEAFLGPDVIQEWWD